MLQLKRFSSLFLVLLLLAQPVFAEEPTEPVQPDIISAIRIVEALPSSWSPLAPAATEIQWLLDKTTAPVYALTDTGVWEPVLASALPEDVTADYAGTYGIPSDAQGSFAYRILLNSDTCWEDGDAITAEDYVFSIQKLLEDEENRANWTFLANAEAVLSGAAKPAEEIISLRSATFTSMQEAIAAGHADFYIDTTHFWGLEGGWRSISDRSRKVWMNGSYPRLTSMPIILQTVRKTAACSGNLSAFKNLPASLSLWMIWVSSVSVLSNWC